MITHLKKHTTILLLTLIIVLGFFVRVYHLGSVPYGFFCDEASIGYNAYSILTHGTDEYGTPFPLFFRAFGEYKSPIATYSTIPFILFFGLTEFATRLQSVLYGACSIPLIFFTTKTLFRTDRKRTLLGILTALFLAISPWHIQFSRVSLEGLTASVFFTLLGFYFFLLAEKKPWLYLLSAIGFSFAIYSYFPARIFIPLLGLCLCLFSFQNLWKYKRQSCFALGIMLFLLIPLIATTLSGSGLARFHEVSIFEHPPQDTTILAHILTNYVSYFSLDFLFFKGDSGMPGEYITRHSVSGMGELYLFQFLLIPLGILYLLKKNYHKQCIILLLWSMLTPIASMLTIDTSVQATRTIIGVIPWQIFSALGVVELGTFFHKQRSFLRYSAAIFGAIIIGCSFALYAANYFIAYPFYSSNFWGWQAGPRDIITYFKQQQRNYDDEFMMGDFNGSYIFLKFYAPNDCQHCQLGTPDLNYDPKRKQLFAIPPDYFMKYPAMKFTTKKILYYPNHQVAFYLGEVTKF